MNEFYQEKNHSTDKNTHKTDFCYENLWPQQTACAGTHTAKRVLSGKLTFDVYK